MSTANFKTLGHGLPLYALDTSEMEEFEQYDLGVELVHRVEQAAEDFDLFTLSCSSGYYTGLQLFASVTPCGPRADDYTREELAEFDDDDAYYYFGQESAAELLALYDKELEQVEKTLAQIAEEYGMMKLGVSARFSNGEVWYSRIA